MRNRQRNKIKLRRHGNGLQRFGQYSRYRADAKNVSVKSQGELPLRRAAGEQCSPLHSRRKCRLRLHHCLPCAKGGGSAQPSRRDCLLRFAKHYNSARQIWFCRHSRNRATAKNVLVKSKGEPPPWQWRGTYGFVRSFDTGLPEIYVSVGASMRHQKTSGLFGVQLRGFFIICIPA